MRKMVAAMCLAASACNSNPGASNNSATPDANAEADNIAQAAQDAEPISPMLKEGKPEACAHPAVKEKLLGDMGIGYGNLADDSQGISADDLEQAKANVGEPVLRDMQALDANKDIGELTCGVNVQFKNGSSNQLKYVLRPSLEEPTQFLIVDGGAQYIWSGAVLAEASRIMSERKAKEPQPQQPQTQENVDAM